MRLTARLVAGMAVAALVPLSVSGWFSSRIAVSEDAARSDEILLRDAESIARLVDQWVGAERDRLIGWTVPFRVGDNAAVQEALLQAIVLADVPVQAVALVDAEGRVARAVWVDPALASRDPRRLSVDADAIPALVARLPLTEALEARERARAEGHPVAAGAAIGDSWRPDLAETAVPIAVAGPQDDGWVLGAQVRLAPLAALVAAQAGEEHGIFVASADGEALIEASDGLVEPSRLAPLLESGVTSTVAYRTGGGRAVRGALVTAPLTGWRVVVAEPAARVEATSREIVSRTMQVWTVAVALALAVGWVLARSLAEPVRELRDAANQVASGDLGRAVHDNRDDELGDLQRAFNRMSLALAANRDELGRQRDEIERFNRELQDRVAERTRELVEAQARLVQSGQLAAVAEMSAGVAHEINNPLAAILGMAQVLRMKARGTPDEERLARIEEQASRCRDAVGALLRLSEAPPQSGARPVVELGPVLGEVVSLVAGPYRQRGVALDVNTVPSDLQVRVDPVALGRILAQVLQAFRAGLPDGGRLGVDGVADGPWARVRFTPDRPIAEGHARDDWMASGMSLWVARRQLDEVGGTLEAPPDRGGAWVLSLPRVVA